MLGALNGFGLAIATMDIIGALLFELLIICIFCRRKESDSLEPQQANVANVANVASDSAALSTACIFATVIIDQHCIAALYDYEVKPHMFWSYLALINVWIVVSTLMVIGIVWHKPKLLIFWLIWCLGGIVIDIFFLLCWLCEVILGDAIEALTNIMISMLTMSIELGFIYVIYIIYNNLSHHPNGETSTGLHPPIFLF